jgi:hypothetical protein
MNETAGGIPARRLFGPIRVGACLSLSGRYAPFGGQAAAGLEAWRDLHPGAELEIEDDGSDPGRVAVSMRRLAARCDVVLGPYSTGLMRVAAPIAAELDRLVWNHGGAGDDVQAMAPGRVVSVLTPAGRYAEPFLRHLLQRSVAAPLVIVAGRGRFGQRVASGAEEGARRLGLETVRIDRRLQSAEPPESTWDLLCAGSFEEDVAAVRWGRGLPLPPRSLCSVAAGVRRFGPRIDRPDGLYGVAQWVAGAGDSVDIGPRQDVFLTTYTARVGARPDYPAVQAAATAALAAHCMEMAGGAQPDALFSAAASLDAETLFGGFGIDPTTGAQTRHAAVLVRWSSSDLELA